jgi:hypothetical protein
MERSSFEMLSIPNEDSVLHPGEWGNGKSSGALPGGYVHGDYMLLPVNVISWILMYVGSAFFVGGIVSLFYRPFPALELAYPFSWPLIICAFIGGILYYLWWKILSGFNRVWPCHFRRCVVFDRNRGLVHLPRVWGGWDRIRWQDADFMIHEFSNPLGLSIQIHLKLVFPPRSVLNMKGPLWFGMRVLSSRRKMGLGENSVCRDWKMLTEFMAGRNFDQINIDEYSAPFWWKSEDWPPLALYQHWKQVGWGQLTEDERFGLYLHGAFAYSDPRKLPTDLTLWRDDKGGWHRVSKEPPPDPLPNLDLDSRFWDTRTHREVKFRDGWDLARIFERYYDIPRDAIFFGEEEGWAIPKRDEGVGRIERTPQAVPDGSRRSRRRRRRG